MKGCERDRGKGKREKGRGEEGQEEREGDIKS
jgi:hypothetical protein